MESVNFNKILQESDERSNRSHTTHDTVNHSYLECIIEQMTPGLLLQFRTCADQSSEWNGDSIHSTLYNAWVHSQQINNKVDVEETFAIDSIMELEYSDNESENVQIYPIVDDVIEIGNGIDLTDAIIQDAEIEEIDMAEPNSHEHSSSLNDAINPDLSLQRPQVVEEIVDKNTYEILNELSATKKTMPTKKKRMTNKQFVVSSSASIGQRQQIIKEKLEKKLAIIARKEERMQKKKLLAKTPRKKTDEDLIDFVASDTPTSSSYHSDSSLSEIDAMYLRKSSVLSKSRKRPVIFTDNSEESN